MGARESDSCTHHLLGNLPGWPVCVLESENSHLAVLPVATIWSQDEKSGQVNGGVPETVENRKGLEMTVRQSGHNVYHSLRRTQISRSVSQPPV